MALTNDPVMYLEMVKEGLNLQLQEILVNELVEMKLKEVEFELRPKIKEVVGKLTVDDAFFEHEFKTELRILLNREEL